MPQNIEIKAKVNDVPRLLELICNLTDSLGIILIQEDTYFQSPHGRLKLRVVDEDPHGQLIFYKRENQTGPKCSEYFVTDIADVASFKVCLGNALGILGMVRKVRQLFMYNNTRIHFDEVEGLGSFVELEVVLNNNQTPEEGEKVAKTIMAQLQIDERDLIPGAYMDLLLDNDNASDGSKNDESSES